MRLFENSTYTPPSWRFSGHPVVDIGGQEHVVNKETHTVDKDSLNKQLEQQQIAYVNAKAKGDKHAMEEAAKNGAELRANGADLQVSGTAAALQRYYEQSGIKVAISNRSVQDLNKGILQAKNDYAWAKAHNDQAGMAAASQIAANMRALGGSIGSDVSLDDAKKIVNFQSKVSGHPVVDIGGTSFDVDKKTLTVDSNQLNHEVERRKIEYLNAQAAGDKAKMERFAKEGAELHEAGATLGASEDTATTKAMKNYYQQADIKAAISSRDPQKLNEAILKAKNDYAWAKAHNDQVGMDAASQLGVNLRALGGTIGSNVSLQDAYKMVNGSTSDTHTIAPSAKNTTQNTLSVAQMKQNDEIYSKDHDQLLEALNQYFMAKKPDYISQKDKEEAAKDDMKYMSELTNDQLYDKLQSLMSNDEKAQYYQKLVQQPGFDAKSQWKKDTGYQQFVTNQLAQNEGPSGFMVAGMGFAVSIMNALKPKYGHDKGGSSGGNVTGNQKTNHIENGKDNVESGSNKVPADKGKGIGNFAGKINTSDIPNMSKQEILDALPSDWKYTENNGFVHVRDASGNIRMRIDPPDKVTNYDHVHLYDDNGNPLDVNLNIVDRKSPDAHIPYKN